MSLDQFFTKGPVAERCWQLFQEVAKPPPDAVFVEPSAGGRAFYDLLPADRRLGFDLDPRFARDGVAQADWLQLDRLMDCPVPPGAYVIGNPPFGYRGSLARKFIEQAFALEAAAVGFIIPASAVQPCPKGCHEALRERLPAEIFQLPDGKPYDVDGTLFAVLRPGADPATGGDPGCASFLEIYYVSDAPTRRCGHKHIPFCDCFLTDSWFGDVNPQPVRSFPELSYTAGYGIKFKRRDLFDVLRAYDWRSVARRSPNGVWHINKDDIHRAVMEAGFVDAGARSCRSYVKVCTLSDGGTSATTRNKIMIGNCDLYLPKSCYPNKMRAYDSFHDVPYERAVGVKALRRRDEVVEALRAHDWAATATQSPNGAVNLQIDLVEGVVMDCGFVDGAASCATYINVYRITAGQQEKFNMGEDKIPLCDLFLWNGRFFGAKTEWARELPDRFVGYGVEILREREAVVNYLLGSPPPFEKRPGVRGGRFNTNKRLICDHVIAGGFVDGDSDELPKRDYPPIPGGLF